MICWSCENDTMEEAPDLGNGWLRCSCGATYIKVHRLSSRRKKLRGTITSLPKDKGFPPAKRKY